MRGGGMGDGMSDGASGKKNPGSFSGTTRAVVIIDNRVRVGVPLRTPVGRAIAAEFTHQNPDLAKWEAFRMGPPPPKKIQTWATQQRGLVVSVPMGGLDRVLAILTKYGVAPEIRDRTVMPEANRLTVRWKPWPHQLKLVDAALRNRFCLWRAPAGSGKTQAVLDLIARLPTPALVVVGNSKLFEQWERRVFQLFGLRAARIQGQRREVGRITIAMQQTLRACAAEFGKAFGLVVVDESQCCASDTIQFAVDEFHATYRLGVSNDERRADRKEFLTYDQFGSVAATVDRAELEESGEVVPVEVRVVPTSFTAPWWDALKPDPDASERRQAIQRKKMLAERARLMREIAEDDARNAVIRSLVRFHAARKPSQQVLVLTERVEHALAISAGLSAEGLPTGRLIGGAAQRADFDVSLADFQAGRTRACAGTYKAVGTGFEAERSLAVGVLAGPCVFNAKSRMEFEQRRGRFARSAPGKEKGVLYYLADVEVFGTNPVRLLSRWFGDDVVVAEETRDGGITWAPAKRWLKERKERG